MKRDLKCVDRLLSFAAKHPRFRIDYSRKITDMGLTLEEFRAMYISR